MRIATITVSYGLTYSHNFQGCRVDVSYGAQLQPGDDVDEVRTALLAEAKKNVEAAVQQYSEERR